MKNPCINCTRCKDPIKCENKLCSVWREWFLHKWNQFNNYYRKHTADKKEGAE